MSDTQNVDYPSLKKGLKTERERLKRSVNLYSYLRLAIFAVAILTAYLFFDDGLLAMSIIGVLMLIVFLILIKIQLYYQVMYDFTITKLKLIENEINLAVGALNIYPNGEQYQEPLHPYTDDLDVFGKFSLFAYINRCVTEHGKNALADWLKSPSQKKTIQERQEAVVELNQKFEEGLNFRSRVFALDISQASKIEYFFTQYLPKKIDFINSKQVKFGVPLITLLTISMLALGAVFGGVFWNILGLSLLASAAFYFRYKATIDQLHENIGSSVNVLEGYAPNIKWIEETDWKSELLIQKTRSIRSVSPLHSQINDLTKILNSLNARLNPIVGIFLNLFCQWDLRCLQRLTNWEKQNEKNVIKGIALIGDFEALISLSTLSLNHPAWVRPVISTNHHLVAEELGHPLISAETRVSNNFNLAKNITIDVITGSNMAGKSTFLRSVGVNMVLAFAGANVCAKKFETSIFQLISYMRIKDSLASQTSTFKAEIDRLKMILDFTKTHKNAFVLVDEMLRGTNSRDKYLGSKVFIKALIKQETPGFIATHDLQIAELEHDFPKELRNFHFDIQIKETEMYFDYKIKQGECKTFNASILLNAIGLDING